MAALPAVEVAIVGAGFAGASTAWWLARRGVAVALLERAPVLGAYASGRSAGMGRQLAEDDATTALTVRGAAFLRSPPAGFPAAWDPRGGVLGFDDDQALAAYVARAARFAVPATPLGAGEVAARFPGLAGGAVARGLWVPGDGLIDVRALLAGFVDGAVAAGARLHLGVAVEGVGLGPGGATLATSAGALAARLVVDASGAWAGRLVGEGGFVARKRHVFTLDAAPAPGAPYLWHLGAAQLYLRPDGAQVMTSPCDAALAAPEDLAVAPAGEAAVRARLGALAPALAGAPVARAWACLRTFAPDERMRLGRDPARPGLLWAAGLGGHGATASPAVGEAVAAAAVTALAGG